MTASGATGTRCWTAWVRGSTRRICPEVSTAQTEPSAAVIVPSSSASVKV
jgi:hypothetical protein